MKLLQLFKSKDFWKGEFTLKNKYLIVYGLWIVYGGYILAQAVSYAAFDVPVNRMMVAGAYIISFLWFILYIISQVRDRKFFNTVVKDMNDILNQAEEALNGWQESVTLTEMLTKENRKLKKMVGLQPRVKPKNGKKKSTTK